MQRDAPAVGAPAGRGGLDELELTGRSRSHVVELGEPPCALHPEAAAAFLEMRRAAALDGLQLVPLSAFRDFARQLAIWNTKFRGERPLLDRSGRPLEHASLEPAELIDTILVWSALPGASRHHWGSDLDVIDRAALPAGQPAQLLPAEFAAGGPFEALDRWLASNMRRFGFFRPYERDLGGVQPEPWHLSFAPVSEAALGALTPPVLRRALEGSALEGRDEVLGRLEELHARYVAAVEPAPTGALAYAGTGLRSGSRPS
jgi:LAS superfamily LD-carboxypeptidase LdcB